jgi:hypothetical protein
MACDKIVRSISYNSTYGEILFLAKNLNSYDVFADMSQMDRSFITCVIYKLLKEENPDYVRKTFVADFIGEKASPECGGLILVYDALLKDPSFVTLSIIDRHNYLFDIYNKLKQFREIKCIESNFRTKNTQVYYNMVPRYIMDFARYIKDHPGSHRDIFTNKIDIRETIETVKYIPVTETVAQVTIIGTCEACGGGIKEWFGLRTCISCDMTTI